MVLICVLVYEELFDTWTAVVGHTVVYTVVFIVIVLKNDNDVFPGNVSGAGRV